MNSLQGQLLVATTELQDPNFFRTVVLIIRHDDEGALGLVLNRPTRARLKQVWKQVHETPCRIDAPLHLGGPVQGPLMALHTASELDEPEVAPGVYYTTDPEQLSQLVSEERERIRFFVGYAGWGAGQLESEMEEGSWRVTPATVELLFDDEDRVWPAVTKEIVQSELIAALKIKHVPENPSWN